MYELSTTVILMAILMHNTDGHSARGNLLVERRRKDSSRTQSNKGSAILMFRAISIPEGGNLEGCREAHVYREELSHLTADSKGVWDMRSNGLSGTSFQERRAAHCWQLAFPAAPS